MIWSYSKYREFLKCQKKWYYSNVLASHNSRDSIRREAFILNQLRSIYAWRGSVVDEVIDNFIIPKLNNKKRVDLQETLKYTWALLSKQLKFAREKKYRDENMKKSSIGNEFCALFDFEYNNKIDPEILESCIKDIYISLENLLESDLFKKLYLEENIYLISQRPLSLKFETDTIRAVPDLIVLYDNRSPLIVDWKVHIGYANYRKQLCLYAYVLSKSKPHKDFPKNTINNLTNLENYQLIEYQLLRNTERLYQFKNEDYIEITNYIFTAIESIKLLTENKSKKEVDIELFETANSPIYCTSCNFKKLCWGE